MAFSVVERDLRDEKKREIEKRFSCPGESSYNSFLFSFFFSLSLSLFSFLLHFPLETQPH